MKKLHQCNRCFKVAFDRKLLVCDLCQVREDIISTTNIPDIAIPIRNEKVDEITPILGNTLKIKMPRRYGNNGNNGNNGNKGTE